MTKTELDELEQKYLLWQDTPTAQQILRLIREYRQLEQQKRAVSKGEFSLKVGDQNLELFESEQ
jgi:hypothetical protein